MTKKTISVLASPGKLIVYQTLNGSIGVRVKSDPATGDTVRVAVYISDAGLYDGATREVFAPGPVVVPDDQRHRRLLSDGDLVIAKDEPPKIKRAPRAPSAEDGE